MTLKRYEPAKKKIRASKQLRPLKLVLSVAVVGLAAGGTYLALSNQAPESPSAIKADKPVAHGHPSKGTKVVKASPRTDEAAVPAFSPSPATTALASAKPAASATPKQSQAKASPAPVVSPKPEAAIAQAPKPSAEPVASPKVAATIAPPRPASPAALAEAPKPASPSPKAPKPAATPTANPTPAVAKAPSSVRKATMLFQQNSSYLSWSEQQRLIAFLRTLKPVSGTIHVTGFADGDGDARYNEWMAERRAGRVGDMVRTYAPGRYALKVDSVVEQTSAGKPKGQRRVELIVQ